MISIHQAAITSVLKSVQVYGDGSFSWFGRRQNRILPAMRDRMDPLTYRKHLIHQLSVQLYECFYTTGHATPNVSYDWGHRGSDEDFVAVLSEHNRSTGSWQRGWKVVSYDSELMVERDGLKVCAEEHDVRASGAIAVGREVEVRIPSEHRKLSPGFFVAMGNKDDSRAEGDRRVRFYWHLTSRCAPAFLEQISTTLNAADIAFRVKVLDNPHRYDRCDAGVVYMAKNDVYRAAPGLLQVYKNIGASLRSQTPTLTRRLRAGLSLAEDPADGSSFGQNRCRVLASGLVDAYEAAELDESAIYARVRQAFEKEGLDVDHPYLNPGSAELDLQW